MRAISLWQPWATLCAIEAKRFETRSWGTPWRGPLAIHAAKRFERDEQDFTWELLRHPRFGRALAMAGYTKPSDLPLGKIVGVGELVQCHALRNWPVLPANQLAGLDADEELVGDFSPGRYAWELAKVRSLPTPLPLRGQQGLWTLPASVVEAIRKGLGV